MSTYVRVVGVAVSAAAMVACASPQPASESRPVVVGSPRPTAAGADRLPAVELAQLDGAGSLHTSDLAGTPAVINFWATTCPFCVEEMPAFERVHQALGDQVRFVGVDRADDLGKARTLAAGTGVTYDLVVDPDEAFFYATSTREAMPTTLFVDERGHIVFRYLGPLGDAELTDLIEEHLLG